MMYAGVVVFLIGIVAFVRPLPRIGLGTRGRAAMVVFAGFVLCVIAALWPVPTTRVLRTASALDELMPAYQFAEHHETVIEATPQEVFNAIHQVTAGEIRYFALLTRIRNPGGRGTESLVAAPRDKPILGVALNSGFRLLADRPDSELVFGSWVAPRVLAVMNFAAKPENKHTRLTTETRVLASEGVAKRSFTIYWRFIYPGSAIIRVEWLRAIKRRAEARHM